MKKPNNRERKNYLSRLWARARDVFGDRRIAEEMVHAFSWFEFGEESVKDLSIIEYESILSWLRWCQARIDMLGDVDLSCFEEE